MLKAVALLAFAAVAVIMITVVTAAEAPDADNHRWEPGQNIRENVDSIGDRPADDGSTDDGPSDNNTGGEEKRHLEIEDYDWANMTRAERWEVILQYATDTPRLTEEQRRPFVKQLVHAVLATSGGDPRMYDILEGDDGRSVDTRLNEIFEDVIVVSVFDFDNENGPSINIDKYDVGEAAYEKFVGDMKDYWGSMMPYDTGRGSAGLYSLQTPATTPQPLPTSGQTVGFTHSQSVEIKDNTDKQHVMSSQSILNSGKVADISITVDILHTYINDLKVDVVAPDGTTIMLHNLAGGSADNIKKTYTTSHMEVAKLIGTDIQGLWTIRVGDYYAADIGSFESWSVSIDVT